MTLDLIMTLGAFLFTVGSGSMEPTLQIGDKVTVNATFPFDELQEGDIIAYRVPDPEFLEEITGENNNNVTSISHRIVDLERDDETGLITEIETKGDNPETNPETVEGIDLTEDLDREELLELYFGKVLIGDHLIYKPPSQAFL